MEQIVAEVVGRLERPLGMRRIAGVMDVGMLSGPSVILLMAAVAAAPTPDGETVVTELRYVPEGWLGVAGSALLLLLCVGVVWMYRREGRGGASSRVRVVLAMIRCLVIVLLAVIFLEPVRVRIAHRWIDSYALVLLDDSSSMDLSDRYVDSESAGRVAAALGAEPDGAVRRADIVQRILAADDRRFLRALAENNRVKLYAFSDEPTPIGTIRAAREADMVTGDAQDAVDQSIREDRSGSTESRSNGDPASFAKDDALVPLGNVSLDLLAAGPVTNVDRALRHTVESLGGAPLAGVVLLSDGGFNQGADAHAVARYARQRGLPIHAVGIGDPAPPRNVRVADVSAPQRALHQDPFSIAVRIASEGFDGHVVRIELHRRSASMGGEGRVVDTRTLTLNDERKVQTVTFERKPESPGRYVYVVKVPLADAESIGDDNTGRTTVTVVDAKTKVLVISGGPSWEYRYLTRLLERDETFDVSCWLQSADLSAVRDGNTVIDHFPRLAEELSAYGAIILMDPDKRDFDDAWCRLVDNLVTRQGTGLLLASARAHTPAFLREGSLGALRDLLPVVLDPQADLVLNRIGHYQRSGAPVEIPETAFGHAVLRLGEDVAATKIRWQDGAEVYWHYPVLRAKPVATVLMRHGDPRMRNDDGGHVLAAVQFVGAGRTGFLAFDGTWRWRRHGAERFDRFWVQMIRYLAEGGLLGGARRGRLITEGDAFGLGETVSVSARLMDAQAQPLRRDHVTAQYDSDETRGEFELAADPERPGWFQGRFVPDRTGSYLLTLTLPSPGAAEPVEITREIQVSRPNIEVRMPRMNREALMALAGGSDGGRYYDVDEALAAADAIPDLHEEVTLRSRPRSLWDNGLVMGLLMGLLCVEWALRKWNRML